ncbi:MAG TPA: hypothetical protein PLZ74_11175 [Kiritimatiellia bacterium]|nr:hypothetical protein [Kiritimatiellia bacterium]
MKKLLIALILLLAVPVWAGPHIEYVTPAASETVAGTTERCTDAEMVAGTSTACAGTPANVKAKLGPQTDGGILIGAGQAAAIEATAAGATTEILVGGGAGAPPVWTTATGSGAPVRATSPSLTTPNMTVSEYVEAASDTLSALQVSGGQINNYGQADDTTIILPACAAGYNFDVILGTTVAKYYRLDPAAGDLIILDGVAGTDGKYIGIASAVAGAAVTCRAIQTGASAYDWACYTVSGAWVAE